MFASPVAKSTRKLKLPYGVVSLVAMVCSSEFRGSRWWSVAVIWLMRKITNSAGLAAATPIRQISRPLSRSSAVIVEASQRTKKPCSGLAPSSAPERHSLSRKPSTVCRTASQSAGPLTSKTTHWVPSSIDFSR